VFCEVCFSLVTRTLRWAVFRVVASFVGLRLVGVEARGDADLEISRAQIGREGPSDRIAHLARDTLLQREQIFRRIVERVRAASEQLSVDVEHGDGVRLHAWHRGGDEFADRLADRTAVEAVATDEDRGRRRLLFAPERTFVAEHDVDARRLYAAHHLDGARKFAFERTHARDFLHE